MKFWKLILVASVIFAAVFALASCGCEHIYNEAVTIEPTCTAEGEKTFTCSLCGDSYTEAIEMKKHAYNSKAVTVTCTTEGYVEYVCADCGHTYQDYRVPPTGHTYSEIVTEPTCAKGGYTTYTCTACAHTYVGNETAKDASSHVYGYVVRELSADEAAKNPDAIGVASEACTVCGAASSTGEKQAVLVYLDFNGDIDLASYEGSDAYRAALKSMTDDAQKKAVAMFDAQKNLDLRKTGYGISLTEDGRVAITGERVQFNTTLQLGAIVCPYTRYTISFDIEINAAPDPEGTNEKDLPEFFALHNDISYGNNRPIMLVLSRTDIDPNEEDSVHTYELYAKSMNGGYTKMFESTGYSITLGRAYSFKLEVAHSSDSDDTFTVYVKADGEVQYTKLGTYSFYPDTKTPYVTGIWFDYFKGSQGNVIDNLVVTAPLAK